MNGINTINIIKKFKELPPETTGEILSYLSNKDMQRFSYLSQEANVFARTVPLQNDHNKEDRVIAICNLLPPRRAFLHYEQKSDIKDLEKIDLFKKLVLRDIPFKTILNTILVTTTINMAFLYINKLLTSAMMSSIFSLSFLALWRFILYQLAIAAMDNGNAIKNLFGTWTQDIGIQPIAIFEVIYKKFGYYSMTQKECVKLALKVIATIAFFYRNEIPRVIMPLFKSSAWTASYFLGLHWLTAEIFMKFRRCQNPYPYFMALQLFIISFCLFRNAADNF